jgi:hypothetical protein
MVCPFSKLHALYGHAMALFLIDALVGAVNDLSGQHKGASVQQVLSLLRKEEDEVYHNQILKAEVAGEPFEFYRAAAKDDLEQVGFDPTVLFQGKGLCHPAYLPAQTRYLGHLTNSHKVGGIAPFGQEEYDVGTEELQVSLTNASSLYSGLIPLVWDINQRERDCPVVLNPDYRDYFCVRHGGGWAKMVLNNAAERKAYDSDPSKMNGYVVLIFLGCPWGVCPESWLRGQHLNDGSDDKKWEMKINGKTVVSFAELGFDAAVAVGEGNDPHFIANSHQEFEIEIKVNQPGAEVSFTSVILL